jgi:hypothetical protein
VLPFLHRRHPANRVMGRLRRIFVRDFVRPPELLGEGHA